MNEGNLFEGIPSELPEELVEVLAEGSGKVRVERIVSKGHASPEGFWYEQSEDEFVVLLNGEAVVRFEGRVEAGVEGGEEAGVEGGEEAGVEGGEVKSGKVGEETNEMEMKMEGNKAASMSMSKSMSMRGRQGSPSGTIEMKPGDWVLIPAGCRHRVERTSDEEETVWLAVFYERKAVFTEDREGR
jgi:cupin 2 domain-containing protein